MTPAEFHKLFSRDEPQELKFRYGGDEVVYTCTSYTFRHEPAAAPDITKSITVSGDGVFFLRKIVTSGITFGRYYCGKNFTITIPYNKIQIL